MKAKKNAPGTPHSRRETTYQLILVETARVLNKNGPDKTSLKGVMSNLGMTHGGFYFYFESKEDLLLSAIDHMLKKSQERLDSFVLGVPAAQALENYLKFYLSMQHIQDFNGGCSLPSLSSDVNRMDSEAKKRVTDSVNLMKNTIAVLLERNSLTSVAAVDLAHSIFVEMIGAVILARAAELPNQAEEILAQSLAAIQRRIKSHKPD